MRQSAWSAPFDSATASRTAVDSDIIIEHEAYSRIASPTMLSDKLSHFELI